MSTATATQVTPERIMQFPGAYAPPLIIEAAIRIASSTTSTPGPKNSGTHAALVRRSVVITAIANVLVGLELLAKDGEANCRLLRRVPHFWSGANPDSWVA